MNFENLTIGQVKQLTEQFVNISKTTNLFNNLYCYTNGSAEVSSQSSAEFIIQELNNTPAEFNTTDISAGHNLMPRLVKPYKEVRGQDPHFL